MSARHAPYYPIDWDFNFYKKAIAETAQGIGTPIPTQDEVIHAQNRLRWRLEKSDELVISGPCEMVGLVDDELIYTSLEVGQQVTGVYISYR